MKELNRNEKYIHKNAQTVRKQVLFVILLFFVVMFITSGIKIIIYLKDAKKNEKIIHEISKEIEVERDNNDTNAIRYNINFTSLKEKESDTVGFIKVNGTDIEHIVVQGKDNSYYLTHDFEKDYNSAGWIFLDYRNKLDGSDKNIIIYGHNMRNNTMFGTLKNILKKDWFENEDNRYITFITERESATYEVFSVYEIEAEDYYIKTSFNTGEFNKYIDSMKARSKYDFNCDVSEEDKVLTLSTCANNNKYRVVLHAKKK